MSEDSRDRGIVFVVPRQEDNRPDAKEAAEEVKKYAERFAGQMNGIYQRCPVCYGEGRTFHSLVNNDRKTCPACEGSGLINQLTGKPPK